MIEAPTLPRRVRRTRATILETAEAVFLAEGYLEASMDRIAARAGVSKQTLYAHFGSKEALFLAMADAMIGAAAEALRKAAPTPGPEADPEPFLQAHAREQLRTATNPGLMRIRRLAIAEADRFPDFGRAVFELGPGSSIARLEAAFVRWHGAGKLNTPDPRRAAETFNWLLMGGPTSEAMLLGRAQFAGQAAIDAHAAECVRVFLSAYGRG